MKRPILFAAFLAISAFVAVSYTSCVKVEDVDPIVNNCAAACDLHGTCTNQQTGACQCDAGWTGTNCDSMLRTPYLGAWNVQEDSAGTIKNYTCVISAGAAGFGDNGITVTALNDLTYAGEVESAGTVTLPYCPATFPTNASGALSGGVLTIIGSYPAWAGSPAYTISFRLTR